MGFDAETIKKLEYAKQFEKQFGTPDPDHDWSMATLVKASVNLPQITGSAKMNIMTGDPRLSSTRLLAQVMLKDGQAEVSFDAIKGMDKVFVTVEKDNKYELFGQYFIIDGNLNLGALPKVLTRSGVGNVTEVSTFSADCPTQQSKATNGKTEVTALSFNTSEIIGLTYNGTTKTYEEWVDYAKTPEGLTWTPENKFNKTIFTDESLMTFFRYTGIDFYQVTINNDRVDYDDESGKYRWYRVSKEEPSNSELKTLDEWKELALSSINDIVAGTYNYTIWTIESLQAAITTESCNKDDDGAIFDQLTDESTWQRRDTGIENAYKVGHPQLQYLTQVEQAPAPAWNLGFGSSLFNAGGVFEEGVEYYSSSKVALYGDNDLAKMEQGFEIYSTGGPIELPFIFGNTAYANQFGYIYWKDGEDPLLKKHFVLMEDARPSSNIYWGEWHGTAVTDEGLNMKNMTGLNRANDHKNDEFICYCPTGHESWCTIDKCYCTNPEINGHSDQCKFGICNCPFSTTGIIATGHHLAGRCYDPMGEYLAEANKQIVGTTYRVMFFGEDGNAETGDYNFPEGYHIAFWIDKLGSASDLTAHTGYSENNFNYSLPELNERLGAAHYNTKHVTPDGPRGIIKCISWELDGNKYLGFGDNSGDEDLNDIVFIVSGNFTTTNIVDVAPIKWHMNYNGQHDTSDADLYYRQDLGIGKTYGLPSGTPVYEKKRFLGWSTTPTGASGFLSESFSATTQKGGMCYYAIWEDDKVDIKWHINADGTHHKDDSDLFDSFKVAVGANYNQPTGEPTNGGNEFLGWSTTPDNSSNDLSKTVSAEAPEDGMCYYAIWNPVTPTPDPEWITWTIACEDLGGTFDYDFNDLVFALRKTTLEGGETAKLELIPLAAGGTLKAIIKYGATEIGEIHALLGQEDFTKQKNADEGSSPSAGEARLLAATIDANTSINAILASISIVVTKNGEDSTGTGVISTNQDGNGSRIPQMILLPNGWNWPSEGTRITTVYESFSAWVQDSYNSTWTIANTTKYVNNPLR